ncbi:MAG TPA: HEPN domain-containing protein [Candidatus Bathyarchaeia archaeon]|nr:HEPN domain-containing protein [Candidatus Bathyarchaeia archaeon]
MGKSEPSKLGSRLLTKAEVKLGAARELYAKGFWEDSASRAYYAMFHAARAALLQRGVTPKTHEGTVSEFGRRLVLDDTFPREMGRALADAKVARETYEYSALKEMSKEEAKSLLDSAETFVSQVKNLLARKRGKP